MKKKPGKEETELLRSVERGEWRSTRPTRRVLEQYRAAAAETMRKDRRINIRISQRDLQSIQKRALHEGMPYQTLISSILHKYISEGWQRNRRARSPSGEPCTTDNRARAAARRGGGVQRSKFRVWSRPGGWLWCATTR